jgi:hypothetical protein
MSDYLDKVKELKNFLLGSDNNMKSLGGCSLYRPDKIYSSLKLVIQIECDEQQHKYTNGSYSCEDKRMSDINAELGGVTHAIIRWNPDNYTPSKGKKKKRDERLEQLKDMVISIIKNPPETPIHVYYMFYDKDNQNITRELPYSFIE